MLSLVWLLAVSVGGVFPSWLITTALLTLGFCTFVMGTVDVFGALYGIVSVETASWRAEVWEHHFARPHAWCMSHACVRGVAQCCTAVARCVAWVLCIRYCIEPEEDEEAEEEHEGAGVELAVFADGSDSGSGSNHSQQVDLPAVYALVSQLDSAAVGALLTSMAAREDAAACVSEINPPQAATLLASLAAREDLDPAAVAAASTALAHSDECTVS